MRHFITLLICLSGVIPVLLYADDSASIVDKGLVIVQERDDLLPEKEHKDQQDFSDHDSGNTFSGYPESFIIPKGVCERGEPVMEIRK